MTRTALIAAYLGAIITANLIIAYKGPTWSVYTAFALIGLDLVARDRLHSIWHDRLVRNMALLIGAGSAMSYAAARLAPEIVGVAPPPNIGRIAVASTIAFAAAATVDTIVYHARRHAPWVERANDSNVASAGVDSIVFVLFAFGSPFLWAVAFGQWTAKIAGGYIWARILRRSPGDEWLARNRQRYPEPDGQRIEGGRIVSTSR